MQNASRDFAASVAALPPADAARVACDASGSRALEAHLLGSASVEHKKQLLSKLAESWDRVALKAPGSFLVEKAYGWGVSFHADRVACCRASVLPRERVALFCSFCYGAPTR